MKGATHFIEFYRMSSHVTGKTGVLPIQKIDAVLKHTADYKGKTLFVWKIKETPILKPVTKFNGRMIVFECPTCGADFMTTSGLREHHWQHHGKSIHQNDETP